MTDKRLQLGARDAADIEVVATLLQDAIIPGSDMQFDRGKARFVMVANRFCWERPALDGVTSESGAPVYQRSLCGIQINDVTRVLATNMPEDRKTALLNLLTIRPGLPDPDSGSETLELVFSGDAILRLVIGQINLVVEDIEATHPTVNQPDHGVA